MPDCLRQHADKRRAAADESPPTCFMLLTRGYVMWYVCRSKAIHTGINESFMGFNFLKKITTWQQSTMV
ncbi:hypothetical protein, partial [Sphingobacterium multivorum]|uniref:hypothetical protein n=1 Tax=Sphingobacterium multivorum TaxID=28454 RepID=UPI002FDD5839